MKPTWQSEDGLVKLYHADCRLVKFPKEATAITDPPYNLGAPQPIPNKLNHGRIASKDFGADFDTEAIHPKDWLPLMPDVVASFYSVKTLVHLLQALTDNGYKYVNDFHWCKSNFMPPLRGSGFAFAVNMGVVYVKEGSKLDPNRKVKCGPNHFNTPVCSGKERTSHSTQKPISVMKWLVNNLTKPERLVIDPFMGSGSTGVAAALLGRPFIGVEQKEEYFKIALRRIKAALQRHSGSFKLG